MTQLTGAGHWWRRR